MSTLDAVLILTILLLVGINLGFGFIHAVGSIGGLLLGIVIARSTYLVVAGWLSPLGIGDDTLIGRAIAFILIFALVTRLVGLVVHWLNTFFQFIPLVPTINHLLGAAVGLIEGVMATGIALYVLLGYLDPTSKVALAIHASTLAGFLMAVARVLVPLIPPAIQKVRDLIQN